MMDVFKTRVLDTPEIVFKVLEEQKNNMEIISYQTSFKSTLLYAKNSFKKI